MEGNPNRKIRDLMLFNPWTRMYLIYKFGPEGMKLIRTFGPSN